MAAKKSTAKKKEKAPAKKVGRKAWNPKIEDVRRLCQLNCTDDEIAAFFGVCTKTVQRKKTTSKPFCEAVDGGRNYGRLSLRRKQVEVALGGNPTMLIWLGKQYLGQTDKTDEKIEIDSPPIAVTFEVADSVSDVRVTKGVSK